MGAVTGIEWTDHTWNPFIGCTKVSPGCAHCYAERLVNGRMGGNFREVRKAAPATFNAPLKWKEPARVFTCSISDFFHEAADPWRDEAWEIIRKTPDLTYQILTKRPERILDHLPGDWDSKEHEGYPNVWLGVSGETLEYVERRAKELVKIPSAVRFLSAEPWLDTRSVLHPLPTDHDTVFGVFDWVILGGESGPGARPLSIESARAVRDVCTRTGIPFFFKQWGGPVGAKGDHDAAILDGRTWKEMPEVTSQ